MTDTTSKLYKPKNKPSVGSVLEYHKQDSQQPSISDYNHPSIVKVDIKELFLKLPDKQFCDLLRMRLKLPVLEESIQESIEVEREYWIDSYTADLLFGEISRIVITITAGGKQVRVRKYYNRALKIFKFIDIAKSDLEFVINISDLSPRLIAELKTLDKISADYVLKLAVGGIFENINSKRYHSLGFAKRLKVRLDR